MALPMAQIGRPATSRSRLVADGVGPHERVLTVRPSRHELWAPLRVLKTDVGHDRLRVIPAASIDAKAFQCLVSYLSQAETFFWTLATSGAEAV
jgi:hypothetical protein